MTHSTLPRERAINTIRRQPTDRIPLYGLLRANLSEPITAAFGSVETFEDHCSMEELTFAFDLAYRLVRELGS